jgi:hypothetical protein
LNKSASKNNNNKKTGKRKKQAKAITNRYKGCTYYMQKLSSKYIDINFTEMASSGLDWLFGRSSSRGQTPSGLSHP